ARRAPCSLVLLRSAEYNVVSRRSAPRSMALLRSALFRSALFSHAPLRLAPLRLTPIRLAPLRLAPLRLAPLRLVAWFITVRNRSASCKSGLIAFSNRHLFQCFLPCLSISRCALFAMACIRWAQRESNKIWTEFLRNILRNYSV